MMGVDGVLKIAVIMKEASVMILVPVKVVGNTLQHGEGGVVL